MSLTDDRLPDDLQALLRDEASRGDPPDEMKAVVRSALGSALVTTDTSTPARTTKPFRLAQALKALGLLATGAVIGAGAHARLAKPTVIVEERVEYLAPPSAAPAPAEPIASAPPPESVAGPTLPRPASIVAPTPTASSPSHLADERRVLEIAAAALGRGDGVAALRATERHAREFPKGQLEEEREAIAIQALVLAGRSAEAGNRAGRFRLRYPDSAFLPAIDEALR